MSSVRAVADAVLYEGYLLYPYRGNATKNQARWQFGVLGPPNAEADGLGENDHLEAQFVVAGETSLDVTVRFLQLQRRDAEKALDSGFERVAELTDGQLSWLTWDEAVPREISYGPIAVADLPRLLPLQVPGGSDIEMVGAAGRLVRTRESLNGFLEVTAEPVDGFTRITLLVHNTAARATDKTDAIARSFIGTHVIVEAAPGEFVSLIDPPPGADSAVVGCQQHRCFPVLAGEPDQRRTLLISPIILYDYPQIAEQSEGSLFDSTEIDEILTLRIMTMTDEEKAQARATDPEAARIIDQCDSMTPDAMQRLHGILRSPRGLIPEVPNGVDWWDPMADTAVSPDSDAVLVNGVRVAKGSHVRLHPGRRADAHDLFYEGKTAHVTSVHADVDGNAHVGVVLDDDPASDLHEWFGRYLYFAPDEVEPLTAR
ncbi:hypothetical protein [Smaragdicoccus niigatensis]|uniref:hypothetical protein n=1 Tax=Smaragdicoccus niigatensis TaxID=359359 RepID=UPI000373D326|nr:hypothetical protein [Smaragdicoccus niigatensis]